MEGVLSKWTNVVQGWQDRYFVLNDDALRYYTSREKMTKLQQRGCILQGAAIGIDGENNSLFTITVDGKTFHMQGKNQEERDIWVRALEKVIHEKSGYYKPRSEDPISELSMKTHTAEQHLNSLIEQTRKLEKIALDSHKAPQKRKNMLKEALDTTKRLHCVVEHSIVILKQIQRDFGHENGMRCGCDSSKCDLSICSRNGEVEEPENEPPVSYSSSGEDEFADASSNFENRLFVDNVHSDANRRDSTATHRQSILSDEPNWGDANEDFDRIYNSTEESDVGNVKENHGNVLFHLLSQLSIGMDLTKVTLPTFILERRSLLEMYADFFAHPDDFMNSVNLVDPEERFLSVVRYYLNSIYPARKSGVAKKPYNPILGEIFRCKWTVPGLNETGENTTSGPFPGSDKNQVTFVGEQVSHHPPISAFYAEHPLAGVSFNAHIYTKSQFLGLSLGVHFVGEGRIKLHKFDEEYTVTFPSAYGRSIMTTPWLEIGGIANIKCEKTGYSATIEFLTKLVFMRNPHQIKGHICKNGEKKPLYTLSGQWNDRVFIKRSGDTRETLFTDVREKPDVIKECLPVNEQQDRESRRLWRHVTAALYHNHVDIASKSKRWIEQRQRREAKERADSGVEWSPSFFVKKDDIWIFNESLEQ